MYMYTVHVHVGAELGKFTKTNSTFNNYNNTCTCVLQYLHCLVGSSNNNTMSTV